MNFIDNMVGPIPRWVWYYFLGILSIGVCLGITLSYKEGYIFRADMPVVTQELAEWSEFDLLRLYNSQRCGELTEFYAGQVEGTEAMKKRCDIISGWWLSYDERQNEKRLELLANDLREYTKKNFVD